MKKQCVALAAAILAVSLGAFSAAAQGPAGVGGDQSPRKSGSSPSSDSGASHSTSFSKWLKRDNQAASAKSTTPKAKTVKATNTESTHARHSLNPVNWIKKDKNSESEKQTTAKAETAKLKAAKAESARDKKAESAKLKAAKAESANTTKASKTESAHTRHSLNPVKWIKKSPEKSAQKTDKTKDKKSSAQPAPPVTSAATPGAN